MKKKKKLNDIMSLVISHPSLGVIETYPSAWATIKDGKLVEKPKSNVRSSNLN